MKHSESFGYVRSDTSLLRAGHTYSQGISATYCYSLHEDYSGILHNTVFSGNVLNSTLVTGSIAFDVGFQENCSTSDS